MTEGAHAGSTPERLEKGSLRGRTGITRGRLWFVHLFIALTVCASLYPIATDMEHWPFSQYPMYSGLHAPTFVENELMGFNDQGEFPLDINRSMEPLTEIRLRGAFKRLRNRPNGEEQLEKAVRSCLQRYEVLRQAGAHDDPPVDGLRMYELTWKLVPFATNMAEPGSRRLLLEKRLR